MGFRSPLHNPKSLQQAGGADRHPCCGDKTSWIGQECHIWIFLNRVCILGKMNCVTSSFEPITYYFYFAVSISKYLDHRHQLAFGCLWGAERHTWVRFCHAGTQGSSFGDIFRSLQISLLGRKHLSYGSSITYFELCMLLFILPGNRNSISLGRKLQFNLWKEVLLKENFGFLSSSFF